MAESGEHSFSNSINELFNIRYPIIQAGMIWCSGWKLASSVSNAGGLGLIGSGSMYPDVLREHIRKCKEATNNPFGVNVPMLWPYAEQHMKVIMEEGVEIVFTSAGNPKRWTPVLKENGITVTHVVSSAAFAKKSQDAGVDAVVAEGFEAGGHNGREETTTMCLVPMVRNAVTIPVIAAGGIAGGKAILAAMVLGADGVQIGSRFAASEESSGHRAFKERIVAANEGDTLLVLKKVMPVRLMNNSFFRQVEQLEHNGASREDLENLLGKGRSRKGMFEGDLDEGELEIGQVSAHIHAIGPAAEILENMWREFNVALENMLMMTTL